MTRGRRRDAEHVPARADPRLEQVLSEVVHEIRQPLAAIFALADAARNTPGVPADVRGYLDRIIEQAGEVSAAAGSIREAPSTGGSPDGSGSVDVVEVVTSVLHGFACTWTGTFTRAGDLAGEPVLGDRAAVRRCLVNIVDNAVRAAGPDGNVTVTVRRGAGMVRVVVEDDGPGFGNVPSGTGLGIEITRKALEAIGGTLSIGPPSGTGGAKVVLFLRVAGANRSAARPSRLTPRAG